ncbi:MAG: D-alanyl-D-alanine carboxypeptidase/D-alanyl-D-alanine-endopeptidase [Candidatus Gastranaerophilaceae bacterium]
MRKIIAMLLTFFATVSVVSAETITKTISSLGVNKSAIAVSIKEAKTGNEVFAMNQNTPMLPASTLKLVTTYAALNTLGRDYNYSTSLYKSTNNDLYIKLGADPFLSSSDLSKLFQTAKEKNIIAPKNVYIDSRIFDSVEWGEGWQWDDDLNPLMPKFSAYNLDGNLLKIEITPTVNNTPATIVTKPFYPLTFMNLVTTSLTDKNSVKLSRNANLAPNILTAEGVVSKTEFLKVPVNNTRRYFVLRTEEVLRDKKFDYFKPITNVSLPVKNVYKVTEVTHSIKDALTEILQNSNNMVAETTFKLAGSIWAKSQGNLNNSMDMLNSYLKNLGLNTDNIRIVDGSGVSKNNIMTSDFMTSFLVKIYSDSNFEEFEAYMPSPGEGTLKNRMLYFKDNLKAKTGTLSDTSAIAGYITTRKGKTYTFDIMINDAKTSPADKKNIEEQILRNVYVNY